MKNKEEELDSDDEAKRQAALNNKDPNFMPKPLKVWLNEGEFQKALKFASSKSSRGSKTSMFYAVITSFCHLKLGKQNECLEVLQDYKSTKP